MQQFQRIHKIQQKDPQFLIRQCDQVCKNKLSKACFGQWNDKEILKYFLFVHHHQQKFQSKSIRKSLKVFKQMAKFIKTRNSSQCRTHHQNLINKCKNIENALASFIREQPSFFDKYECIKETLNILDDMQFCSDTSTVVRQAKQAPITYEAENSSTQSVAQVSKQRANVEKLYVESQKIRVEASEMRIKKLYQFQLLFNLWAGKVAHLTQIYQI